MENTSTYLTALLCVYGTIILLIVISLVAAVRVVREGKRLSVYRLGRFLGEKGPGLVLLIPFVDRGVITDFKNHKNATEKGLVGALGETRSTVFTTGKVLINDEEWDATSQSVISAGRKVRVLKMILEVEEV